ncbi:Mov34/MPN/PAD-1 family protein [Thalassospira alkalitolerans]|uniref:Mov34/MPN/PAD-1 family protein n=1 Tax=Thalassospira alkalitolerans TaxID=1293890 RepID=UPI003AA9C9C5
MNQAGHVIKFPADILIAIADQAATTWPEECCGLLIADAGSPDVICRFVGSDNVAADRQKTFEIDPHVLIATHRSVRASGEAIVGCFHSHPNGDCSPSKTDLSRAEEAGFLWLIVATGERGVIDYAIYRRMPTALTDTGVRHFQSCTIVKT